MSRRRTPKTIDEPNAWECRKCGTLAKIVQHQVTGNVIRYRKECPGCGERFTTYEIRLASDLLTRILGVSDDIKRVKQILKRVIEIEDKYTDLKDLDNL